MNTHLVLFRNAQSKTVPNPQNTGLHPQQTFTHSSCMNSNQGILIIRVGIGLLMLLQGVLKLVDGADAIRAVGAMPFFIPDHSTIQITAGLIAVAIEVAGGLAFALGYRFKLACLLLAGLMLVAFSTHSGDFNSLSSFLHGAARPLELALVFVGFYLIGPGKTKIG